MGEEQTNEQIARKEKTKWLAEHCDVVTRWMFENSEISDNELKKLYSAGMVLYVFGDPNAQWSLVRAVRGSPHLWGCKALMRDYHEEIAKDERWSDECKTNMCGMLKMLGIREPWLIQTLLAKNNKDEAIVKLVKAIADFNKHSIKVDFEYRLDETECKKQRRQFFFD